MVRVIEMSRIGRGKVQPFHNVPLQWLVPLFASLVLAVVPSGQATSIASLVIALLVYLCLLVFELPFFAKYFPFILYNAMSVLGCAFCEHVPLYLTELEVESSFEGSLPLLIFSRLTFIFILLALDRKGGDLTGNAVSAAGEKLTRLISIVFDGILVAYLLCVVPLGPAASLGLDRFRYAELVPFGEILLPLSNQFNILVIAPILALSIGQMGVGIAGVVLYAVYLFWTGNKFGGFVFLASFVFLALYPRIVELSKKSSVKMTGALLAIMAALLLTAVGAQYLIAGSSPVQYLGSRLAQQGQLWWKMYSETGGEAHLSEIGDEIIGQIEGTDSPADNVGSDFGIYKVMYQCAPKDIVDAKLARGSTYAEAAYPAAYYYMGPAGPVIFSLIGGVITVIIVRALVKSMQSGLIVNSILLGRFLIMFHNSLGMFMFTDFFELKTVVPLAYLVSIYVISRHFSSTKLYSFLHKVALV